MSSARRSPWPSTTRPVGDAILQQRVASLDVLMGEDTDLVERLAVERGRHEIPHLSEVLIPEVPERLGRADGSDLIGGPSFGMGDGDERERSAGCTSRMSDLSRGEHRQPPICRHAPHPHRMVDHDAAFVDDVLDSEVHVGREPTVQVDLAVAHLLAALERAEVDEREPHILLSFVDDVSVERNGRDVRLEHLSPAGGMMRRRVRRPAGAPWLAPRAVIDRVVLDDSV